MIIKLALRNVKNSFKDYSIYFITLMISVAIFYIFNSIEGQKAVMQLSDAKSQMLDVVVTIINYLSYFIALVMGFLIIYANNFLIKRRSKELGLYLLLGMKKSKISLIYIFETFFIGLLSLVIGLIIGVYLGQLFSLFTTKIFEASVEKYQFIFSFVALRNTLICFAAIFIVVMIFNVAVINKAKLINLIHHSEKNEKVILKKVGVSIVTFIASLIFLGFGYYCIIHNNLQKFDSEFFSAFLLVLIGTILFFFAVASALLVVIKKTKWYYRGLNMFVTKELNKNANSNIGTMIFTCLTLAVTIVVLSSSFALTRGINQVINGSSPYDMSIYGYQGTPELAYYDEMKLSDYASDYVVVELYSYPEYTYSDVCGEANYYNSKLYFIKQSAYNKAMSMQGAQTIALNQQEFYVLCQYESFVNYMVKRPTNTMTIFSKDFTFTGYSKGMLTTSLGSDDGLYVVVKDDYLQQDSCGYLLNLNYKKGICDEDILNKILDDNPDLNLNGCSRQIIKDANTGFTALVTFVALYISIAFLVTCVAIISIQQLSRMQDNIEAYKLLHKLGVSKKKEIHSIFLQTLLYFLFPLILAIVHATIGIIVVQNVLFLQAPDINILGDILATAGIFLLIYGSYFLITFLSSIRIITRNTKAL